MTEQKDNVHSSVPVRTPKSQLAAEQPSTGECWIPGYQKKIPHIQGQRRSHNKTGKHLYICDFHKNLIQNIRNRKGNDDDGGDWPVQDVDTPEAGLHQLQVNTLRRWTRHFTPPARPGLNKAQLVKIAGCSEWKRHLNIFHLLSEERQEQESSQGW